MGLIFALFYKKVEGDKKRSNFLITPVTETAQLLFPSNLWSFSEEFAISWESNFKTFMTF